MNLVAAAVRPSDSTQRPRDFLGVWKALLGLRADFLGEGGATIDTPEPAHDGSPVTARTVVQLDGDMLVCIVEEPYLRDLDLQRLHAERVQAWFARLESTLSSGAAMAQTAGLRVAALISVVCSVLMSQARGLLTGALTLVALPLAFGLLRQVLVSLIKSRIRVKLGSLGRARSEYDLLGPPPGDRGHGRAPEEP